MEENTARPMVSASRPNCPQDQFGLELESDRGRRAGGEDDGWAERAVAAMEEWDRRVRRVDAHGFWAPPESADWSPGRWLWSRRTLLRWSQKELARRAGVGRANLSRAEADGDVRLSTLRRAAEALGCELHLRLRPRPGADALGPPSPGRGKRRGRRGVDPPGWTPRPIAP